MYLLLPEVLKGPGLIPLTYTKAWEHSFSTQLNMTDLKTLHIYSPSRHLLVQTNREKNLKQTEI